MNSLARQSLRRASALIKKKNGRNTLARGYATNLNDLPEKVKCFVEESAELCNPDSVHVCDGSQREARCIANQLVESGALQPIKLYKESYYARTDPRDVARTEGKTFLATFRKCIAVPDTKCGVKRLLGNWMDMPQAEKIIKERFTDSMRGRTMYVIPYVMGPIGSYMSRTGVQVTDSAYVVLSTRIMTRMGSKALEVIKCGQNAGQSFARGVHCCGKSAGGLPFWPCDPDNTVVIHMTETDQVFSYGSGYGGNSILAKKCHALRLASCQGLKQGWMAEHMLILGIEPECGCGEKRYLAAAFPSACGKTNLAMLKPSVPGYKITTVGDDIAWIHFDKSTGKFHAINPENGMFGVAPGTSWTTNPNAMASILRNSLFTNVALTSDGGVWWEGMEEPCRGAQITDWKGKKWNKATAKTMAAHPNSRFTCPLQQCPSLDKDWENCKGVPISAFLFGGRRPTGLPLVFEALHWNHGVLVGSMMKSQATAAAEHKGGTMMHDPFAMRPFFGYNAGHYMQHWINMGLTEGLCPQPKIFHVNWFLKNNEGKFEWPGFGENVRVLDWIMKRLDGQESIAEKTPIGYVPTEGSINMDGLEPKPCHSALFNVDKDFWMKEVESQKKFFEEQLGEDLPCALRTELQDLQSRLCCQQPKCPPADDNKEDECEL